MSPKLFSILLHLLCYFRIQIDDTNSFFIRIWQALWFWSKKCKEIFPVCEGQVSCISLRWAWPVIGQKNKIERSRVTWKPLIRSAQKDKNCPSEIKKKKIFVERNCRQNEAFWLRLFAACLKKLLSAKESQTCHSVIFLLQNSFPD